MREFRQGPLALRREQTLGFQPGLEQLKLRVQVAQPLGLDAIHVELITAARLIDADLAVRQNLPAVDEQRAEHRRGTFPHHARNLGRRHP